MLNPYKPTSQQVYEVVRQAIIRCKFQPGSRLSEQELSQQFGVSRQPVREAFIKLSQDGLILVLPQRGTFVSKISAKGVNNGRFIREAVEIAISEKAALNINTQQLALLESNLQAQELAARNENRACFIELDDAFHRELAQSIDCVAAWENLADIKANMDRVRYLSLFKETPFLTLTMQHRAIFDAIKARNPEAARLAVKNHLSGLNFSFASISTRNAEWFEN